MGFLKSFFASLLAIFVSLFIIFFIGMIIVISSQRETEPYVRDGSVLEIKMGNVLLERAPQDPFSMLFRDPSREPVTLTGLQSNFEKAAADDRIEGIWLKVNNLSAPWNNLVALRNEMISFREETGKFLYVTTDDLGFNEQSYFLATAADSIFSPPETFFEFDGFFIQSVFFKDLLEKVGVETQIFRAGAYKSAVEPFERTDLSEENEEQLQAIVDNVADVFLTAVGERSGKSRAELDAILNAEPLLTSREAYDLGFIDKLIYPDEVESRIKARIEDLGHSELRTVSYQRYSNVSPSAAGVKRPDGKDKIAVVYASGNITPEYESSSPFDQKDDNITANRMQEHLKSAVEDDNVKAIVIRINSPGGAGSTSDLIWQNIKNTALEKPVIASFGSVAASGGYYIGMAADTIVASSQTITGSIGVFGMALNLQELFNDKLGITFDEVTSHDESLWLSGDRPLSDAGERAFQRFVDDFYDTFLVRVAESRNITVEEAHEVAQGRVWTGTQAYEVGLVDVIGELNEAIAIAAEKAGIEEYAIETFPKPKSLIELFTSTSQTRIRTLMNPGIKELETLRPFLDILPYDRKAVIARIPFDHKVH